MCVVALIAASLSINSAFAHAELQSAEPAAGLAATTSPKQIRITFNEAVIPIPQVSGVELKDQAGRVITTGKAVIDPANKNVLVVPISEQLMSGTYKVEWHAVSNDTHRVKGNYAFSVGR